MEAQLRELNALEQGVPVEEHPVPSRTLYWQWSRRHPIRRLAVRAYQSTYPSSCAACAVR